MATLEARGRVHFAARTTLLKKIHLNGKVTEIDETKEEKGSLKSFSVSWVSFLPHFRFVNLLKSTFKKFLGGASAAISENVNNSNKTSARKEPEPISRPKKVRKRKSNPTRTFFSSVSIFPIIPILPSPSLSLSPSSTHLQHFRLKNHQLLCYTRKNSGNEPLVKELKSLSYLKRKEPNLGKNSNNNSVTNQAGCRLWSTSMKELIRKLLSLNRRQPVARANLNHLTNKTFRSRDHLEMVNRLRILCSNNVEPNPGPPRQQPTPTAKNGNIEVMSMNVRGLNDPAKLRHLLNRCYVKGLCKYKDSVFCFQETFIEEPGLIPFLWRGNFFLTPGRGYSLRLRYTPEPPLEHRSQQNHR